MKTIRLVHFYLGVFFAPLILFFACSVSFSLALLANTVVVGALAGLYWIMTLAGKA